MGSRLVYDLAVGLAARGFRTYRYNMRGVRGSAGTYDRGRGEVADAVAVYDALATGAAPVVFGHSFGAGVAVGLAARRPVRRLVLAGTPLQVSMSDLVPLDDAPRVSARTDLIVGDRDEFVSVPDAGRLAGAFPDGHLHVLPGAGHFLVPDDNPRVVALVARLLGDA